MSIKYFEMNCIDSKSEQRLGERKKRGTKGGEKTEKRERDTEM